MVLLFACAVPDPSVTDPIAPGRFRVALLSDTHIIGPQYECCSENGELDNSSIMKTSERLASVVARINAIEPAPELVFVLGDVLHDAHVFDSIEEYATAETAWSRAAELFGELEMPYHLALGNHDYSIGCDGDTVDRAFTHTLFDQFFSTPPYEAVDHRGWRFVVANSQSGPTWDRGDARCDTGLGSYGTEQLEWIAQQLGEGVPSFLMAHYYLLVTARDEDPEGRGDIESVIAESPALKLFLAGHSHRWIDFIEGYPVRHILMASTRYDDDDFWLVEFEEDGEEWEILDYDKPDWFTTCASTWTYDGTPAPDPSNPPETGDCGS